MIRYQILIEYVGTNFRGWQVQKKGITVQGLLQQEISKILKEKIKVYGSGRTDAGVHAIQQSAHFDTCLLYTSPSPRDRQKSRMPSSA